MNLVDSSALIEYFMDTPLGARFATAIEQRDKLIVPTIVIYEVTKRIRTQLGKDTSDTVLAELLATNVVALDAKLACSASRISTDHKLAMADAIIYATARHYDAILWTQDEHFNGLPGVRYVPKTST
ncbi:putative nucleic acid-binding protein [Opitutaceae bacterium TAV1]|nr:putative nucleic acid-binding protein [Opitutaceae bacterium TAV1]